MSYAKEKEKFKASLTTFVTELAGHVSTKDKQWTVKGYLTYRGQDTKLLNPRAKTTRRKA